MAIRVIRQTTADIPLAQLKELRAMLDDAYAGDVTDSDWRNSLGGTHFLAWSDSQIVGHVAVIARELIADEKPFKTGYLETVATRPEFRRQGIASELIRRANALIRANFALGALATGLHSFYEKLGWERWRGPTYVGLGESPQRSPDADDAIMILRTPDSAGLRVDAPIRCGWREGDSW